MRKPAVVGDPWARNESMQTPPLKSEAIPFHGGYASDGGWIFRASNTRGSVIVPAIRATIVSPKTLGLRLLAAVLPAQERPHEETRLFTPVGAFGADRARPASPASLGHAIPAGCASKMTRASRDIVACV
jgi:hypothetical protein